MEKNLMKEMERLPVQSGWFSPFQNVENWFDDVERRWLRPSSYLSTVLSPSLVLRTPHIDIIERGSEVCVRAEMPGVEKGDLSVSLQDDMLTLKASISKESEDESANYYRREMLHGGYQRTVQLPAPVDASGAKATFKNGILELIAAKKPGSGPLRLSTHGRRLGMRRDLKLSF